MVSPSSSIRLTGAMVGATPYFSESPMRSSFLQRPQGDST